MSTITNDIKFPEGLRVLVVDDNVDCLKLLCMDLLECKYKVTATTEATKALELLRKNKDEYDIFITQTKYMIDFEFLKITILEIGIPIIIISENDDKDMVLKGVINGAQDYLVKPVRIEVLRNIWQHVLRKNPKTPMIRERENKIEEKECTPKRPRVSWSKPLQDKFADVVDKLGSKAVPNKILEMMNEPHLNRGHIASHLQNYKNGLKKGKIPTTKTMTFPISTNIQQPVASTSVMTPNTYMCNRFNMTNIPSVPNNVVFCTGPTNNQFIGLQPYLAPPKSFGFADIPFQPPSTNDQNSIVVMSPPISNLGQTKDNGIKFNPSQMDLPTTMVENPLHMKSRIYDENQWTKNAHMRYIQEELEKNIDDNSFDEDLISLMMKELSESDHLTL
ncbi:two-component response regulator ARR10-like [Impatiens glandulifera]|uniref:two-component response regulator ARR10-like n=1 Tax=Impatiens glandulifera TaxID=253017 RepID=UPI001FB0731F|nr:two-component response regulator ARR10-like [Impatiens glandulifera]